MMRHRQSWLVDWIKVMQRAMINSIECLGCYAARRDYSTLNNKFDEKQISIEYWTSRILSAGNFCANVNASWARPWRSCASLLEALPFEVSESTDLVHVILHTYQPHRKTNVAGCLLHSSIDRPSPTQHQRWRAG
jgi:hypothetical protein